MVCFEIEYWNINRILLLIIGMWPYQQSKLVQFQIILCYGILISIIVVQLSAFLTTECTVNFFIKNLSAVLYFCLYVIFYNSFWVNISFVRHLLNYIQYIYDELKDENEIAIIESYGYEAKRCTAAFTLLGVSCLLIAIVQPWIPCILNTFLLINDSQPYRSVYIITEYFVDKEKYFYLILLHVNVVFCLGTFVLVGTGTMLLACSRCICGMFKIASYRIEQALEINIAVNLKNDIMIYNKIIHAVDIHRKATMIIKSLISNFEGSFVCTIMFCVTCLSLNLFQISQYISFGGSVEQLMLHGIAICIILVYIFISNYFAQEMLDHNSHIFATVYNTRWYTAPLYIQKMILFLLQRGTKVLTLNVGGLFSASLESIATIPNRVDA
ncbi:uncharacterized protein LOC105190445 isoform X2 [Harpegnathos saltator]|uniref:uncharacterized protein LOC105190445 isoform X2 n=1 Tax=Harpegnathos saltator TaxID=610380 RepID=UPI0009489230|nr:uncharacterized protein LOC105190445 isoform X2 [Harpegnathos saltator]